MTDQLNNRGEDIAYGFDAVRLLAMGTFDRRCGNGILSLNTIYAYPIYPCLCAISRTKIIEFDLAKVTDEITGAKM
jgi:hypothetical protein